MTGEAENSRAANQPSDPSPLSSGQPPFWHPSAGWVFTNFGYRWLFILIVLLPGAGGGAVMYSYRHTLWTYVFGLGVCLLVSVPIAWSFASKAALREIPGLFCIHCGMKLADSADEGKCPRCGRAYSLRQIEAYRNDPSEFLLGRSQATQSRS